MSEVPLVFVWDAADANGDRHGGNLVLRGLNEAQRRGLIELEVLTCWYQFSPMGSVPSGSRLRNRGVVFFIHENEECACHRDVRGRKAAVEIISETSPFADVLTQQGAKITLLLYSGGGTPARLGGTQGSWVRAVGRKHLRKVEGLDEWIADLFKGANQDELVKRFERLSIPFSYLSAVIHDLDNRIAPLRIDLDLLNELDGEQGQETIAEVIQSAVGTAGEDAEGGYLFGTRRGHTLRQFITTVVPRDNKSGGLTSLLSQVSAGRDEMSALLPELCGSRVIRVESVLVEFESRLDELKAAAAGSEPGETSVILDRLIHVDRWLTAFSKYLRFARAGLSTPAAV